MVSPSITRVTCADSVPAGKVGTPASVGTSTIGVRTVAPQPLVTNSTTATTKRFILEGRGQRVDIGSPIRQEAQTSNHRRSELANNHLDEDSLLLRSDCSEHDGKRKIGQIRKLTLKRTGEPNDLSPYPRCSLPTSTIHLESRSQFSLMLMMAYANRPSQKPHSIEFGDSIRKVGVQHTDRDRAGSVSVACLGAGDTCPGRA